MSGQCINFSKSSFVISNRCPLSQVRALERFTGISKTLLPMTYLGCPLFNGRKKIAYFAPLMQKIHTRLAGWKGRFLSSGGRLVLLRHVLQAMPIHLLSTMDPPKGVLRHLECLFSNFGLLMMVSPVAFGGLGAEFRILQWRMELACES